MRCKDGSFQDLLQHMNCDANPCCRGNEPFGRLPSDLIQPSPRVNPYTPQLWTPPLSPPPESPWLPSAPVPNMAALPYELLKLLLSSLDLSDLLACRAVSRRLSAAASSQMRGGCGSGSGLQDERWVW